MEKVKFNQMKDGTKEEYMLLDKHEKKYIATTGTRLLKFMGGLNNTLEGYQITRLEHSLQTATRALNDKASDEMIVASLVHDIVDVLARSGTIPHMLFTSNPSLNIKTETMIFGTDRLSILNNFCLILFHSFSPTSPFLLE